MTIRSTTKRKVIGWSQINQNGETDWAKGEGDATNNKKMILEITGGEIPLGSTPEDNADGFTGVDGPSRIFADQYRGAKGGYSIHGNPESLPHILTMLMGPPSSSANGDSTYTHTWELSNINSDHYGNMGFLDYESGVDKIIEGFRAANFSIKSAGEEGKVDITFDGLGKLCDEVSATNADEASGTGTHGFQRVSFGAAKTESSATGLANDATEYTANITTDGGTPEAVAVTGSAAQTIATLITEINADLSDAHCLWCDDGNGFIKIVSNTTGASSSVSIGDVDLFSTLTDYSAVDSAIAGYLYPCPSLKNFNWKDCSFSINSVADAMIRDMEISVARGNVEKRNGSKYLGFSNTSTPKVNAKFSRFAEDSTYQAKQIAGTLHPLVWVMASSDIIGTGTQNPTLTITLSKLFIRDMPGPTAILGLEGLNITGESMRECGDGSNVIATFALVNEVASYAISI